VKTIWLVAALTPAGAAVIPTKRLASVANVMTTPRTFNDNLLFIDFKNPPKIT
jgi:hypothetical protein